MKYAIRIVNTDAGPLNIRLFAVVQQKDVSYYRMLARYTIPFGVADYISVSEWVSPGQFVNKDDEYFHFAGDGRIF